MQPTGGAVGAAESENGLAQLGGQVGLCCSTPDGAIPVRQALGWIVHTESLGFCQQFPGRCHSHFTGVGTGAEHGSTCLVSRVCLNESGDQVLPCPSREGLLGSSVQRSV